jgi:universal stress protein family protein
MPQTIDRDGARLRPATHRRRRNGGPVLLATFDRAPLDLSAARLAVESAADMRATLHLVDTARSARQARRPVAAGHAATIDALRALAAEYGVPVEETPVVSRRPDRALLGVVEDRRPALVVLGADPAVLRRFRRPTRRWHRRFIRVLAEQTACLVWIAQEPLVGTAFSPTMPSSRARPAPMRRARPGAATTITRPTTSQIATTNGKRS